jgi:hypothetical protein
MSHCALQALESQVTLVNLIHSMDYWIGEEQAKLFE